MPETTPPQGADRPWYLDDPQADGSMPTGDRLQKVLAAAGWGSRRVCEDLIRDGRVRVGGEIAVLGRRVDPEIDLITGDGAPVAARAGLVHYLLNKPAGVVTTAADTHGRPTVLELVPAEPRVFPVGRLDMDSEGLLLITNDGDLANAIAHPSHGVDKEYLVMVSGGRVSDGALRRLRDGVEPDDGPTAPARVSQPEPGVLRITIHEGRNRQVRRMCAAVGHEVTRLVRTRIGPIADRDLAPGAWRALSADEVIALGTATGAQRYARRPGASPARGHAAPLHGGRLRARAGPDAGSPTVAVLLSHGVGSWAVWCV